METESVVFPHIVMIVLSLAALIGLSWNHIEDWWRRLTSRSENKRVVPKAKSEIDEIDVLEHLVRNISFFRKEVMLPKKDALFYRELINQSQISMEALRLAVHQALLWYGYKLHDSLKRGLYTYPDQTASPEALGYAIVHGAISPQEIAKIRFAGGETLDTYRTYAEGLLDSVVRQICSGSVRVYPNYNPVNPTGDGDTHAFQ